VHSLIKTCALTATLSAFAVEKPNVIIIMADDLGYGDLGCYGNTKVKTPNLDQMATEGIRFTDFHSNGPVCSPTRAALLTGKYQQRVDIAGVVTAKKHRHHGLKPAEKTFAETMKENGYTTGIFGKWHLGYDKKFNPIEQGFDEYIGFVSGNVDYHSHVDQEGYEDWWNGTTLQKEKGYTTDLITKHSVNFIKKHKDKPFVLYIPHEAPHYPIQGRESKPERTIGKKVKNPHGKAKNKVEVYREMIEVMDEGIGEIITTLKSLKLDKKTLVLFLSDNGGTIKYACAENGGLRDGKGSVFEGGHRVPAIAWWPDTIKSSQTSSALLTTMDIYPTIVDLADGKSPQDLDGISFRNHLLTAEKVPSRDIFWEFKEKFAARSGSWKLVKETPDSKPLLFNLSNDLGEKKNLAPKHPELTSELTKKIEKWYEDVSKK
jgi:arylsulfatase A-like enzyme